jgi:hypothetical protein
VNELLAADFRRIWWRPMTRAIGLVAVILIVAIGIIVFVHTSGSRPFNTRAGLPNVVAFATAPLTLVAFIFGASLLGADYSSRSLTTLLTWEPRRARLLLSRAATCAATTFGASLAALALLIVALAPAALGHGKGGGPAVLSLSALVTRSALLAAAGSAVGVSCAAIGRSTTAALIGAAIYLVVIERVAVGVAPDVGRWLLINDSLSWVAASPNASNGPGGVGPGHTVATSGLLLLVAVVGIHALAAAIFVRRDVV